MESIGSLCEILLCKEEVTTENYRRCLAGDERRVYDTVPPLSYGRIVRAVWLKESSHCVMLDKTLHKVGQGFLRDIQRLREARGHLSRAFSDLTQAVSQEVRDQKRVEYKAWGMGLMPVWRDLEWLQRVGEDLEARWESLRAIMGQVAQHYVPPEPPSPLNRAAAFFGAVAMGMPAAPAAIEIFAPELKEEIEHGSVELPARGLQELFDLIPVGEGFGRFDQLRRLTGLFPPIGALAHLRHDHVSDVITSWIGAINRACEREDEPLTPRLLHHTLLDLSIQFAQDLERPSDRCGYIEWILEENGCTVFQQEDPGHRAWVESLEVGSELREGDRVGTLGQDLGSYMFRIEGTHNVVRFDPLNEARLGIRRAEQTYHAQSSVLTFSSVGPLIGGGRAARCEVLSDWAAERQWKDDVTDQNFIKSFAAQMTLVVNAGRRPAGHLRDLVRTNDAGHIRWETGGDEMVDVDVLELEDFFRECSKGKETIFHQWMDKTRMSECPKAMQLRGDLMAALRGSREGLSRQVLDMVPRYDAIIKRAARQITVDYEVPPADKVDDLAALKAELLNQLQATLVAANVILEPPSDLKEKLIRSVIVLTGRQYSRKRTS